MIIRFDHITHVTSIDKRDELLNQYMGTGYVQKFCELNLQNLSIKDMFCALSHETHDMYYLEHSEEMPVEVVVYDKVSGKSNVTLTDRIVIPVYDDSMSILLEKLGARVQGDNLYNMKGCFDKKDVFIKLIPTVDTDWEYHLDYEGIGCVTLMLDSISKQRKKLEGTEFICSEEDSLVVNGKTLKIMFVTTPKREMVFELISM